MALHRKCLPTPDLQDTYEKNEAQESSTIPQCHSANYFQDQDTNMYLPCFKLMFFVISPNYNSKSKTSTCNKVCHMCGTSFLAQEALLGHEALLLFLGDIMRHINCWIP